MLVHQFWKNLISFNRNLKQMKESSSRGSSYKCSQVFGYKGSNEKVHEEDIISMVKFDQDGKHLALGDKAGRVIIFRMADPKKKEQKYTYFTEFQAYTREFDPLNSSDIDEEVTGMTWMAPQGNYLKMLTMNAKAPKLWKIFEKPQKKMIKTGGKDVVLPKFQPIENSVNAVVQKAFPSKHEEDLVGVDFMKNEEYLLCSDTVKTILWNMEKTTIPYMVADLQKTKRIEDVKENINCIKAHPQSDSLFAYGTNRGLLALSDMRTSDSYSPLAFKVQSSKQKSNFFTQMISSYSSLAFINSSRYIATRDYLTVKVWDIAKNDKPVHTVVVQQALKSKLCDIFQNDCIFDKFQISASKDSNTLLTGNYNNTFHTIDLNDCANTQFQVNYKKQTITKPILPGKGANIAKMDYTRKTIASDFHPKTNLFAVASLNCFLTYTA